MRSSDLSPSTEFDHSFEPLANHHPKTSSSKEEELLRAYHTHTKYIRTRGPARHSSDSPCSSSATLLDEDHDRLSADLFKLIQSPEDGRALDTGADPANCTDWPPSSDASRILPKQHLHAPTPTKPSLNPKAAPFIPSLSQATLGSMQMQTSPVPARSCWMDSFCQGTSTGDLVEQEVAAKAMILATKWSFDNICVLVQMFCWECARPTGYGPFARAVYEALKTHYGEWESSCFRFHLRKCALESFRIAWSSINPRAISRYRPPTPEYLQHAYHISTFVAELFAVELIPWTVMIQCLGIVLNEMCSVEHVYVLQNMVISAKETLWHGPDSQKLTKHFIATFAQRTSSLPDHASFGPPVSIATIVKEANIARKIHAWHSTRPATCPIVVQKSVWS